jgi:hypothetical protein
MAAPNPTEIANMRTWSIYKHYYRHRQMYVVEGRAIAAGIRTILLKAQPQPPAQPPNLTVAEDDIAAGFLAFLLYDPHWSAYLHKKATMARFIAWDAYVDIVR